MKSKLEFPGNKCGFTLLELTCVVALMSILFGVVFFGMEGFTASRRLSADARNLAAFVQSAREQAITESRSFYLVYDLNKNMCFICANYADTEKSEVSEKKIKMHKKVCLKEVRFSNNKASEDQKVVISISSIGDIESHKVILKGEEGTLVVAVSGVLGTAKIEEEK